MKKGGQFWVGFSDLMTSMFFVMLVLYAVSLVLYKEESKLLQEKIVELETMKDSLKIQADKFKIIQTVEENLDPLKKRKDLFTYDKKYKRFNLSFDVKFKVRKHDINGASLFDVKDIDRLKNVGWSLKKLIDNLVKQKKLNKELNDVSYLVVVSGSASNMGEEDFNYVLSYKRAYHLFKFWRRHGVNLDSEKYHDIVDFQIAGNGFGGIGRFKGSNYQEEKNQRFIINIIPKIGEIK